MPTNTGLDVLDVVPDMLTEIRERRASDLTEEERAAIASLRATIEITGTYGSRVNFILAALDKILGGKA